jgi:hypothetical protein
VDDDREDDIGRRERRRSENDQSSARNIAGDNVVQWRREGMLSKMDAKERGKGESFLQLYSFLLA